MLIISKKDGGTIEMWNIIFCVIAAIIAAFFIGFAVGHDHGKKKQKEKENKVKFTGVTKPIITLRADRVIERHQAYAADDPYRLLVAKGELSKIVCKDASDFVSVYEELDGDVIRLHARLNIVKED